MKLDNLYIELKKRWDILIIFVLFSVFAIYDYSWIVRDTLPPRWDDAWHLMSSLNYYQILTNPSADMFEKLIHVDWYYPPFYKFSTAFLYMVFGTSITTAIMINVFYFGILLFSTYGIGKILFNRETGLLAAVLVSLYPIVFSYQRVYLLDLGLAVMVTLSIYLLLRTENFKSSRYSLAFGAVLGMSLLVKWTAVFFIAPPFMYTLYKSFFLKSKPPAEGVCEFCGKKISNKVSYATKNFCSVKCKKEWKQSRKEKPKETFLFKDKRIINLIVASAAATIIAAIWYVPNGAGAYKFIVEMDTYWSNYYDFPELFSFQALSFYVLAIISQASFTLAVVFLVGLVYLIKTRPEPSFFLLSWIIFPLIVLTSLLNKNDRYSMPILAAVAIISAFWIISIGNKKTRATILIAVLLLGGVQMIAMASGNNSMHNSLIIYSNNQIGNISLFPPGGTLPRQEDWKHEEILNAILKDALTNERVKARGFGYIVVVPDHGYINGRTFEYYNFKMQLPFQVYNGAYIGEQMFITNFLNIDYLIIKSGENGGVYKKIVDIEYDYFEKNRNAYLLINEVNLPDGSILSVYRNKYIK